ncbi:MAG TPA: AAA family ATPase [Tepidisphaeraceae bacterium]|nr:AAA family ATPase [Tepidisphaeraceae bacterium]
MTNHLVLSGVGPLRRADLTFGDLTVFVGPQATGKSIALQFLKLFIDMGQVQQQMARYGLDWDRKGEDFLDVYFGEGMHSIWGENTLVEWNEKPIKLDTLARMHKAKNDERMFLIPAQRVLALRDGWPRPFTDYSPGDPYTVRDFSEKLRTLVEREFNQSTKLFPQDRRLKRELRRMLTTHVFGKFSLSVDKVHSQKRLVLGGGGAESLPFMVWSAGQREFVPLLLGLYWLMPPTKISRRGDIKWVVVEELEMGLHPRAITVVMLMILELMARGYRVCISTHSPQVIEAVWAIQRLREARADGKALLRVFKAKSTPSMQKMADAVLAKEFKVFYFDRDKGTTADISGLDPADGNPAEADWGGLTEFSAAANAAVAEVASGGQK